MSCEIDYIEMSRFYRKSYNKGDVLLKEEPFAFVLKSELNAQRCDHCFKGTRLLKCAGCSFTHYCDRTCQRNGWKYHKYECSNIKRLAPRIVPDAARMLKNGAYEKYFYTESKFRMFKDLMSPAAYMLLYIKMSLYKITMPPDLLSLKDYNDIKKDTERVEHFVSLNVILQLFLKDHLIPNEAELFAIYCKMVVNTFNILDLEMRSIGTGLYLGASVIDHSCSPNAVAVFDGLTLIIRTLQNIETLDWTKVSICYIELLNLPSVRQKELESRYYFLCQCERCVDVEELNLMTSVLCQNENCNMMIKGGLLEGIEECPNCGKIISGEVKNEMQEIVRFSAEQLQKMTHLAYLDICRVCLKKQEKIFSPFNIYKVKILDSAMESCIELGYWEEAFEYGKQLLEPFRKYYGILHPIRGIFLMKLGKIASLLNHVNEAKEYFKEAASILLVTHGDQHPLTKEELMKNMQQCLFPKQI